MLAHNLLYEILIPLQGKTEWVMDSGCTNHMTGDRSLLMESSLSPSSKKTITFADKDFSEGPQVATCLMARASECWLWHQRLGHAGMRNLQKLVLKKHVLGIEEIRFTKDRLCGACEAGKMTKAKHPAKTIMTTTHPLELLHMDLFGLPKYSSFRGSCYGLVIVDDFSRYTWVHFLTFKSETLDVFKHFAKCVMNNYNLKIKHI